LCGKFTPLSVSGVAYTKYGQQGIGKGGWGVSEVDPKAKFDVDDYAAGLIRFDGMTIFLESSWALPMTESGKQGIDIYGTRGGAHLFPASLVKLSSKKFKVVELKAGRVKSTTRFDHFVDCVLDNCEMIVKPEQSLVVQQILDAIYKSARSGKEVRLRASAKKGG